MEAGQDLDAVFADVLDENNAQEVLKRLEDLDNRRLVLASRWVWELIQNARGTGGSQSQLEIEVGLNGDDLIFRHNGAPFRDREIAHLILHGSTKHDPRDIGRFGTGFITTHLISRRVRVRGRLIDGRPFDFFLNREGINARDLQQAMKASREQFRTSLGTAASGVAAPFTTEYVYPIAAAVRDTITRGLDALRFSAAYVFAFNPMLSKLTITTDGSPTTFTRETLDPLSPGTLRIGLRTDGREAPQWIITTSDGDVVAALLVDVSGTTKTVCLPGAIPRLFVAFPLGGTERLCVPLVMNSELFVPREDRDGVFLGVGTNEANKDNMLLFSTGCERITALVSLAAQQSWTNAPQLTILQPLENMVWADGEWLKSEIFTALIQRFRGSPLLKTASGKLISPRASWIPVGSGEASALDVWLASERLASAAECIPRREDQEAWALAVESWVPFFPPSEASLDEVWTVGRLADHLAGLRTVAQVAASLQPGADAIAWINGVHGVINKAGHSEYFSKKALIPNQLGEFCLLSKLCRDGGIDKELKDIGELAGVRVRAELIDPGIDPLNLGETVAVRTEEQVITQLLDTIGQRLRKNTADDSLWAANIQLFGWLLKRSRMDKLDGFSVRTILDSAGKQGSLLLRGKTVPGDRILAPVVLWPEAARPFSDLLPETAIMDQRYAEACNDSGLWQKLAEGGFLLLAPLYEAESIVDQFLPDEPLRDDEQKLRSEKAFQRSEIAWLNKADRSIIDRVRGSQARAVKLLRFCVDYVLPADPQAFTAEAVHCDNGVDHRYYRANWLGPLRTRRWVPLEKGKNATPSAEHLAKLLAGDPDLLKQFCDERVSKFLEVLGVSPADLALRSIGRDDPERMSLIQSLAIITSAAGNDPVRVQALAGAIQTDPEVLKIVEDRQDRKRRIARNQELGSMIEGLFKDAFGGTGLAVRRTGPGHDFRVEAQSGEEQDVGQVEIEGTGGSVLVEVKATTGTSVRMSVKQVEQAVINKHRYFLCVVGAADRVANAAALRSQAMFVVDIGDRLEHLWGEYSSMEDVLGDFEKNDVGLTIEVTGHDVRFCVDEGIWVGGLDFPAALELLREKVLAK